MGTSAEQHVVPTSSPSGVSYDHIVVVHGIGDQKRNETALAWMNGVIRALSKRDWTVASNNLIASRDRVHGEMPSARRTDDELVQGVEYPSYLVFKKRTPVRSEHEYRVVGFSEVYWKDIPDERLAENQGDPAIPIFTWARSISVRLASRGYEYHRAKDAIDNLEKLLWWTKGLTRYLKTAQTFDTLTKKFLADVQYYAENDAVRHDIDRRFWETMARVGLAQHAVAKQLRADRRYEQHLLQGFTPAKPNIYVVAHSEGTVISYFGLVAATLVAGEDATKYADLKSSLDGVRKKYEKELIRQHADWWTEVQDGSTTLRPEWWLPQIKGFVTMGSPLDKHVGIWPSRFRTDLLDGVERQPSIWWTNYWDKSDPVGYGLQKLFDRKASAETDAERIFSIDDDRGFWRYPVPLKAHVDYWRDDAIYEAFTDRLWPQTPKRSPGDSFWVRLFHGKMGNLRLADTLLYLVLRAATLGAFVYFGLRIVEPARRWLPDSVGLAGYLGANALVWWGAAVVGPVILAKVLWQIFEACGVSWRRTAKTAWATRFSLIALSVPVVLLALLGPPPGLAPSQEEFKFSAWIGFIGAFLVTIAVWQIHTSLHRGLLQMWRYTDGAETQLTRAVRRADAPPPPVKEQTNRAAEPGDANPADGDAGAGGGSGEG